MIYVYIIPIAIALWIVCFEVIKNIKIALTFYSITLNYKWYDLMWTPDVYIVNLKSGLFHKVSTPNRRFRLSPNGLVYYSQRLTVTMYCDMVLDRFPMDNQTRFLELSSCEYMT